MFILSMFIIFVLLSFIMFPIFLLAFLIIVVTFVLLKIFAVITLWKLCSCCMRYCIFFNIIFSFFIISVLLCNLNEVIYSSRCYHVGMHISELVSILDIDIIASFIITFGSSNDIHIIVVACTILQVWVIVQWPVYTHYHRYMPTW